MKANPETDNSPIETETLEEIALSIALRGLPFSAFKSAEDYKQTRDRFRREILLALRRERARCERIAKVIPESRFDLDHEPARTEQQIRDGIARAIREGK